MNMIEPQTLVHLQGGLGNLMFQIATFESIKQLTSINIAFTNFDEQAQEYYNLGRVNFFNYKNTIFSKIKTNLNFKTNLDRIDIVEHDFIENFDFIFSDYYIRFIGYGQNHQNFISRNFTKQLFDIKVNISENYKQILDNENCLALHVRRKDYLNIPSILPCQSIEYFNDAVDYLGEYEKIFIFSDDINWCKENFKFNKMNFIDNNEIESLKMMTMCNKHIISNSTFSWWGAYLSKSDEVVLPNRWFGPEVLKPRPIEHYKLHNWFCI